MKVVIPKMADNIQMTIKYINNSLGTTLDATNDLYYLPSNIIFNNNLLHFKDTIPDNPKVGDVYDDNGTVVMYCSDGTWQDTGYDSSSWDVVNNYLLTSETTGAMKTYLDNGGHFTQSTCANVIQHFPVYDKTADYNIGDIVEIGLGVIYPDGSTSNYPYGVPYKCITTHSSGTDGSTAKDPLTEPTYWERLPFYNQFAIYDKFINTTWKTRNQDMVLDYENITDIDFAAILNPKGTTVKFWWGNTEGSAEENISLNTRITNNFNEYFFKDFTTRSIAYSEKQLVNVDNVAVTLEGDDNSASSVIVGKSYDIGNALYGYKKQLRDFSKKVTNAEGYDYLQKGNHSNKLIVKLTLNNDRAIDIYDLLSGLSSTLCLYVLEDGEWVFGYFKDLYMVKSDPVMSDYELEINGVI